MIYRRARGCAIRQNKHVAAQALRYEQWQRTRTRLPDGPKHGYAMLDDIEVLAGVRLGPGTLYGALARLERLGLIEATPADRRHHFKCHAAPY